MWSTKPKWGFIDKTGKVVITPGYDEVGGFAEGLSAVKLNGKWGFIDKSGRQVIPPRYDSVSDGRQNSLSSSFYQGLAVVKLNGKWGYIGRDGTEYFEH